MTKKTEFTESMVMHVLTRERYPTRFEDFCVQLFSDEDQITYVRTSRSHDLGKDGRGVSHRDKVPPLICCGTEADVVSKAVKDATRLAESVVPAHLIFCFTDPHFSEDKAFKIDQEVRRIFPDIEIVRAFGANQLSQLAVVHPAAFSNYYAPELQDLRGALSVTTTSPEVELTGLRVALTTLLDDDAQTRRRDLVRNLILTALSDGQPKSAAALAKSVSDKLKLPRIVHVGWLQSELNNLTATDRLKVCNSIYSMLPAGQQELTSRTEQGSVSLMEGRSKIQDLIADLTGSPSSQTEFNQVWNILRDGIAIMFLSRGAQVAESIAAVLGGETSVNDQEDLKSHIEQIGDRIRSIQGGGVRIQEVAQAVVDMFGERTSAAFEWLASICEVFLHLCTLGLEPASQEQVKEHLSEIDLILDTDVALTLISEGEQDHASVRALFSGWESVGGALYVTEPILEEMSHHAWIGEVDYRRVGPILEKMDDNDMAGLVVNVFVRGFFAQCRRTGVKCTPRRWQQYISAFKGKDDVHFDNILIIMEDYHCKLLPEAGADGNLATSIASELLNQRKERIGSNAASINDMREKSSRDGRLLAVLARHRSELKDKRRTAYIVSGGLRNGARILSEKTGDEEPVIYVAAVAWFLSLVPGVKLNATTLRRVLFDADIRLRIDPLERVTLRYLRASEEYKMHLSRRGTLKQAVRAEIRKHALEAGVDPNDVERRVIEARDEDIPLTATLIAKAVDNIAFSESERTIASLKQENEKLREKVRKERERRKHPGG